MQPPADHRVHRPRRAVPAGAREAVTGSRRELPARGRDDGVPELPGLLLPGHAARRAADCGEHLPPAPGERLLGPAVRLGARAHQPADARRLAARGERVHVPDAHGVQLQRAAAVSAGDVRARAHPQRHAAHHARRIPGGTVHVPRLDPPDRRVLPRVGGRRRGAAAQRHGRDPEDGPRRLQGARDVRGVAGLPRGVH